jgi:hypothetical protein
MKMKQREVMDDSLERSTTTPLRFRFNLRAMFIALTMAAGAIWLFMEYAGLVGLFFAITVLSAAWCILRANRAGAAGYLAVFAVAWVALQFFGPYTTFRNRVVWVIGTERFQQWAVEVLDNPPPVDTDGMALLERDSVPEELRCVAGHRITVYVSDDGSEDRISLRHGGGFYYWGILVGRPGYTPHYPNQYDKIEDGIWGYQGGA